MDTISSWRLWTPARWLPSWRRPPGRLSPSRIRGKLSAFRTRSRRCKSWRERCERDWGRRIAAVTGSVGKTTTKEILAALLGARFRVLKSEGNLNNEYGLPLQLLRLERSGRSRGGRAGHVARGELRRLAEIAEPEVGVVTRVAPVHLEFFASVDEIALAKRELIEGLAGREQRRGAQRRRSARGALRRSCARARR